MKTENQLLWEKKVPVHFKSDFYNVQSFLDGQSSLTQYDLSLIKPLTNKRVLHLQCHFGLDTISIKREGAHEVIGIDFCEIGLEYARKLARDLSIETTFINSDVMLDLSYLLKFDLVYTSYGVLCWLEDINKWAVNIYNLLEKDGCFVLTEFHPLIDCYSEFDKSLIGKYEIYPVEKIEEMKGTYADRNADIEYIQKTWHYSLTSVISALNNAGLCITFFEEKYTSPFKIFESLVPALEGGWEMPKPLKIPLIYSLIAQKK